MTRFSITVVFLVLSHLTTAFAQTTTIADARIGVRDQATYHYVDVFQIRGRWIAPDVGYIDFADTKQYREWFVGAGYKLFVSKHFTLIEELYFVQTAGPASGDARYIQPWTGIFYSLSPKLGGDVVVFPYIPLNNAGRKQWVLERAKLEYSLTPVLKIGAGYGAYQFGGDEWQHRPFITTTITPASGRFGSLELWYQKFQNGTQVQVRYELLHKK